MFYYEVAIGGNGRSNHQFFTYSHNELLPVGTIVYAPFRKRKALGFIVNKSSKPSFATRSIQEFSKLKVPKDQRQAYKDLCALYPLAGQIIARLFLPKSLKQYPISSSAQKLKKLPPLNVHQQAIVSDILRHKTGALIHGETGSGKTRMYMHLIAEAHARGKNVVLLEPEIGLASYIHKEILSVFPDAILYHSNLKTSERNQLWHKAYYTKGHGLIIGPRSALGLPIENLGLIITDEAHDTSYRQDNFPYLTTQHLVASLTRSSGAYYVYGSATPGVSELYYAQKLQIPYYRLTQLAREAKQITKPLIIDASLQKERLQGKLLLNSSIKSLEKAFKNGEQALILLNRRGTARLVHCNDCNHELTCNTCNRFLVYHHDAHYLACHYCQTKQSMPQVCPKCSGGELVMVPYGTKAIEREIAQRFPNIKTVRYDTDATGYTLDQHKKDLENGTIQCLIGTQMIAKGVDLPALSTLIVVHGSGMGGFSSEERQFQLLYQVVGRAYRGHRDTTIVIQTNDIHSKVIGYATNRDYESFYQQELSERERYIYPPYVHLMVVHIERKSSKSAETAGQRLIATIKKMGHPVLISSPLSNTTEKVGTSYRWHVTVKSKNRSVLKDISLELGTAWLCELDAINLP